MKIVAISVVRNEADLIEVFARHCAAFADEILVLEHGSLDATPLILAELREEGLPIVLRRFEEPAFDQSRLMTELMREAAGVRGADWILPFDADEFLTSDVDPSVRPVLEQLPRDGILTVPWRSYVPDPSDKPDEPHLHRRIVHRRRVEGLVHRKVLVPGELARRQRLIISHGSHHVRVRRRLRTRRLPARPAEGLVLAHFPVRSSAQITQRAITAWPVRLATGQTPEKNWALHELFRRVARGERFGQEDLRELAIDYAQPIDARPTGPGRELVLDPVRAPARYALRRPGQPPADPRVVAANLLEEFAAKLGAA